MYAVVMYTHTHTTNTQAANPPLHRRLDYHQLREIISVSTPVGLHHTARYSLTNKLCRSPQTVAAQVSSVMPLMKPWDCYILGLSVSDRDSAYIVQTMLVAPGYIKSSKIVRAGVVGRENTQSVNWNKGNYSISE